MVHQRGSVLVLVTITVALLMFVGVTFATATSWEYRSAMNHTWAVQAQNIADAGMTWARQQLTPSAGRPAARQIVALPNIGDTQVLYRSALFGGTDTQLSSVGELHIRLTRTQAGTKGIVLISEGASRSARRSIGMIVDTTGSIWSATGHALVHEPDRLTKDRIVGAFTWGATLPAIAISPQSAITTARTLDVTNALTLTSAQMQGDWSSISISGTLTIDTGGIDIVIRTNTLSVGDRLVIRGGGRVTFHVLSTFSMGSSGRMNETAGPPPVMGNPDHLHVYYYGSANISFSNNMLLVGSLVVAHRDAQLSITGQAQIIGHLITNAVNDSNTNAVDLQGGSHIVQGVIYAPNGTVECKGNSITRGAVMASILLIRGDARAVLDNSLTATFGEFIDIIPHLGTIGTLQAAPAFSRYHRR